MVLSKLFAPLVVFVLLMANSGFGQQLITYPTIPGRDSSDQYSCRVRMVCSNDWHEAFVGQTVSQPSGNNGYIEHLEGWSASWASFEFENTEVVVEVSKVNGSPITSAMVRPEGFASPALIENGKAYITFSSHTNVNVDIDGQLEDQYTGMFYDGPPIHTISLFGNPVFHVPDTSNTTVHYLLPGETIPTDLSTWDTLYFAPGIHHIGTPYQISSNKTLYIPGNAIVHGTIHPPNTWGDSTSHDWTVYGSGAISGEEIPHWSVGTLDGLYSKTFTHQAKHVHLEGFVVIDPAHHTFNMMNSDFTTESNVNIYKNLKILGWRLNSDGINAFTNSEITNCFFRCQDDLFYYGGDLVKVSDCVTWSDYNGSVVKVIWGSSEPGSSYFKDIRCIYHRAGWHYWDGGRIVNFTDNYAGEAYRNVLISNVLVEDPYPSLPAFNFKMHNPDSISDPTIYENVVIEKVVQLHPGFPNDWGDDAFSAPQNNMLGSDSAGMFSNILFRNCYYGGSWIDDFESGDFQVNEFVEDISFVLDDTLTLGVLPYEGTINGFLSSAPATPEIFAENEAVICDGAPILLNSSSAVNNLWSTGSTASSILVDQPGDYSVSVSNGGCTETSAIVTVEGLTIGGTFIQPQDQSAEIGGMVSFNAGSSLMGAAYQWQTNNGNEFVDLVEDVQYSGTTTEVLNVSNLQESNNNQEFRCIITVGSCTDTTNTAAITITVGVNNQSQDLVPTLSVFPNPVGDHATIEFTLSMPGKVDIDLLDAIGKQVKRCVNDRSYPAGKSQAIIQFDQLSSGIYFLQLRRGDEIERVKIFVR